MRDAARELGVHAGLVLSVQGPGWRLKDDAAALEFVHDSASRGHELLLGGLGPLGGNQGKGEFHRLGTHESRLRLTAARRQLTALGLHTDVFAPTRWLASEDAVAVASQVGFDVAADAYTVRDLQSSQRFPLRVLAFGDGFGAVKWWRRNVINSVRRAAQRQQDVRLSISAAKADKEDTLQDMLSILGSLHEAGYRDATYRSFVANENLSVA